MDFVSPLLNFLQYYLAEPIARHALYAFKVKAKIDNLRDELSGLSVIEEDVGRMVDAARAKLQTPLRVVISWQEKVEALRQEVGADVDMETTHVINHCSPNFISRYKLGKQATQHLLLVKELKEEGKGFVASTVVDPNLPSPAEANYADLGEEVNTLTLLEADVVSTVDNARRVRGLLPKHQVEGWLLTVANHKLDVKSICDQFQLQKEQGDLERNDWVTVSVNLHKTLEKTRVLINEGRSFTNESNVVDPSRPLVVVEQSKIPSIGQEKACADVLKLIKNDDVRSIGIYGMGGVGKTTLLKQINNSIGGMGYEIIIFVVVSSSGSIEGIQRDILKRLGNTVEGSSSVDMGNMIRMWLDGKKFILMLDDLWNELDLEELGVPIYSNQKNYKILFTTRDESVCDQMKAKKVKIECLNDEEAWKLFATTVGETIFNSNPRIKKIGELIAKECGGLPLALTVIGGAMRSKKSMPEWSNALSTLGKFEPELTGTLDKLYNRLMFSYDNLSNEIVKECFCYFALFCEDAVIDTPPLIDCWIGEGFSDGESIENARNKGYSIIAYLIRACLLEEVENEMEYKDQRVKMHDVVRDMALRIKKDKYVVYTRGIKAPKADKRGKIEKLSLTTSQELENFLVPGAMFLNVSTLLMSTLCVKILREDFFLALPNLRVLHIHGDVLLDKSSLPVSTWRLTQLRYFSSGIMAIPLSKEFGSLMSLEILKAKIEFDHHRNIGSVSLEGIVSSLAYLRVLQIHLNHNSKVGLDELGLKIADLKLLAHLEDLKLPICNISFLRDLAACPKLAHCVSGIWLVKSDIRICRLTVEVGSMDRLEHIAFVNCESLEEIIIEEDDSGLSKKCLLNLKELEIGECGVLRKLYFDKTLPQLDRITIYLCSLPVLFSSRAGSAPYIFPELKRIFLAGVGVEHLCSDTFSFPRLEELQVGYCQPLRRLPKGIVQTSKHLKKLISDQKWWDELEWGCEEDKMSFLPLWELCRFIMYHYYPNNIV